MPGKRGTPAGGADRHYKQRCLIMTCGECLIASGGYGFQGPDTVCEPHHCAQSGAPPAPCPHEVELTAPSPKPVSERLTFTVSLSSARVVSVRLLDVTGALIGSCREGRSDRKTATRSAAHSRMPRGDTLRRRSTT